LWYTGTATGDLTLYFYDAVGRYHGGYALSYSTGLNQLSLAVDGLRAGLYIIRWRDASGRGGTSRLIKLNE
jgi:hypothetical protein